MTPSLPRFSPSFICALLATTWLFGTTPGRAAEDLKIQLASDPTLSPDGKTLWFAWRGDLWSAPVSGGQATQRTTDPARDSKPLISPDGSQLAFISDRANGRQVFVMPVKGGSAKQLTSHSSGYVLHDWFPEGKQLLVSSFRDETWKRAQSGFFATLDIDGIDGVSTETPLFSSYGSEGSLSPDGQKLIFTREGEVWWRQGYTGARAGQLWSYHLQEKKFTQLIADNHENRWARWLPDGQSYLYVSNHSGIGNLWQHDQTSGNKKALTHFGEDNVLTPAISRDGSQVVFRHGFDLYRWQPNGDEPPAKIVLTTTADTQPATTLRPRLSDANAASYTTDGLQVAFTAGGDVWVMDTELREPRRVTFTAEEERQPVFSPDGKTLWFVSDKGGAANLWRAHPQAGKNWWESNHFKLEQITDDEAADYSPIFTADSKKIAWMKGLGEIWIADAAGKNAKRLVESWSKPEFVFSPDGQWLAYSTQDESFNSDIWITPVDGAQPAVNLSRHPYDDYNPIWSPDGKQIAWLGKRENDQTDIFCVWLRAEDGDQSNRDRRLAKARAKFKKDTPTSNRAPVPKPAAAPAKVSSTDSPTPTPVPPPPTSPAPGSPPNATPDPTKPPVTAEPKPPQEPKKEPAKEPTKPPTQKNPVRIDFANIHDRVRRFSIPSAQESQLVWSPDSSKIAFSASIDGRAGTYTINPPDDIKPRFVSSTQFTKPQWLKEGDQLVGISRNKIVSLSLKGSTTTQAFQVAQETDRAGRQRAIFEQCWRLMRDEYYDAELNHRDWNQVREKYAEAAAQAADDIILQEIINMMLGELNGSHLGYLPNSSKKEDNSWKEETAHLGLRFDPTHKEPGWKVRDVIPKSPASKHGSRIQKGEIILRVDGRLIQPQAPISRYLNGPQNRDISLTVLGSNKRERQVTIRPITYTDARQLLYQAWTQDNQRSVEKASQNTLGYLHISAMDESSFNRFQEDLYAAGAGKDGLIIDVRENSGGYITDLLLTALTQPQHAIAVPRGGGPGYPHSRSVFATWHKPIVVLCNQNSYSNAEVFSHAIKTLKRGQLVGVPTAGGVISTGSTSIMDAGSLRMPFRGWYHPVTGEDYELAGAVPDHLIWPQPEDESKGIDRQLDKAIEVLKNDVTTWKKTATPKLRSASERTKPASPSN